MWCAPNISLKKKKKKCSESHARVIIPIAVVALNLTGPLGCLLAHSYWTLPHTDNQYKTKRIVIEFSESTNQKNYRSRL